MNRQANPQKIAYQKGRRSGFIAGLFQASPIPVSVLPKNIALQVLEEKKAKPISTDVEDLRDQITEDYGYTAVNFIPTRDKKGVQMITQPYKKKKVEIDDDDELVLNEGDLAEDVLEIGDDDRVLYVDAKSKRQRDKEARQRYRKAQKEYEETQAKKKARSEREDKEIAGRWGKLFQ